MEPERLSGQRRYTAEDIERLTSVGLQARLERIDNPLAWKIAYDIFNTLMCSLHTGDEAQLSRNMRSLRKYFSDSDLRQLPELLNGLTAISWSGLIGGADVNAFGQLEQARWNRFEMLPQLALKNTRELPGFLIRNAASYLRLLNPGVLFIETGGEVMRLALYISFTDEFILPRTELDDESWQWCRSQVIQKYYDVNTDNDGLRILKLRDMAALRHQLPDERLRKIGAALLRRFSNGWATQGFGERAIQLESNLPWLCASPANLKFVGRIMDQLQAADLRGLLESAPEEIARRLSGRAWPARTISTDLRLGRPAAIAALLADNLEVLTRRWPPLLVILYRDLPVIMRVAGLGGSLYLLHVISEIGTNSLIANTPMTPFLEYTVFLPLLLLLFIGNVRRRLQLRCLAIHLAIIEAYGLLDRAQLCLPEDDAAEPAGDNQRTGRRAELSVPEQEITADSEMDGVSAQSAGMES